MMQAFIKEHPGLHRAVCQAAVETLNEALAADPAAINAMFLMEVEVNEVLAAHPTIQVGSPVSLHPSQKATIMRPLGLINGLFGIDEKSRGFIDIITKESPTQDDWIAYFTRLGD